MKKLIITIGTRPELIKLAPVINQFKSLGAREQIIVVNTSQHKELLESLWATFDITPDAELDYMLRGQCLSGLTERAIHQFQEFLDQMKDKEVTPVGILAQGDTTTVMVSSMLAFYNRMEFYHLEAGLRSFDMANPFPEEFNRRIAGIAATVHFAPTDQAKMNLLNEGCNSIIHVTGNTVVDSLQYISSSKLFNEVVTPGLNIDKFERDQNLILITCHRRENFGENLEQILKAVKSLAKKYANLVFLWTMHPNPNVMDVVKSAGLEAYSNIVLIDPLNYMEFLKLLSIAKVVISDSGGVQEEAPSFNVPVLVLREKTERPEGVEAGIAHLVGGDADKIESTFKHIVVMDKKEFANPYGDGKASNRVVKFLMERM